MKKVAVLGGGPAGSFAAERLAAAGLNTIVIDEKLAWEKPCGGGLTYKAYNEYPFLIHNNTAKKVVTETYLAAPKAGAVKMNLTQPLVIYSRFDLNRMLLQRAEKAGAQVEKTRVLEIERKSAGWLLRTRNGSFDADYCVVATGARNPLRNVGTEWTRSDTMYALGYYVPADQNHIDIQFLPNLEGYIWVFPRCGHLSVGICGKGEPAQALRSRLEKYMDEKSLRYHGSEFYGHVLPSLETAGWRKNRVAGDGWIAVGDAAGLVDPITGEGLYYAMRSGDLASQVILNESHSLTDKVQAYCGLLRRDFAGRSRIRSHPCETRVSRPLSIQHCARADDPLHAPQPALSRVDAGFVCRHAVLQRAQETSSQEPERHHVGGADELVPASGCTGDNIATEPQA